jgi:hypothetical protein
MALASAQIGSTDNGYYQADKPTMLACPPFADGGNTKWRTDGVVGSADQADADYPVQSAYDGQLATFTRPTSAQQVWYFIADLATGFWTIDAIFLHVQDVDDTNNATYLSWDVSADGSVWESIDNLDTHYGTTPMVNSAIYREFWPILQDSGSDSGDDQRQWTGARYLRIKFDADAGETCQPQINELIVGQQRQMPTRPLYPFGEDDDDASNEVFISQSGQRTIYQTYGGGKSIEARWVFGNATDAAKIKSGSTGLRADMKYGARPFIWCPNPYTAKDTAYLMTSRSPNEFRMKRTSSVQWEFQIDATETGGSYLVNE